MIHRPLHAPRLAHHPRHGSPRGHERQRADQSIGARSGRLGYAAKIFGRGHTAPLHHLSVGFAFVLGCLAITARAGSNVPAPEAGPAHTVETKTDAKAASLPAILAADKAAEAKGLISLGQSLTDRADFPAAEIAFRQILSSRDFSTADQKDALLGLARCYRRQGTFTKAAAIYEKFLKEFPTDGRVPDALLDLGRTLRAMGAYRLAINRFYSVINSTLKLPAEGFDHYQLLAKTAQFEIAETHFAAGEFAEAGKFFARLRLLDLAPADRARAHFKSAYALQLAGDLEGAVPTLRAYLDQWPQDENVPEARYLLATTLRQLHRPDEALAVTLDLLRAEKKVANADQRVWLYWQRRTGNQLANEFFQNGDTINALAIYQGLAALSPEPAWRLPVTYQVALCYERLRLVDRARTMYQSIVDTVAQVAAAAAPNAVKPDAPPAEKAGAVSSDLAELARMARWRLSHLDWNEQTQRELTAFFSTTTGRNLPAVALPAQSQSAPAAPTATQ
jgi:TolA-binding protein